eukprot:1914995-Pyramimonas_sp.AAC.1
MLRSAVLEQLRTVRAEQQEDLQIMERIMIATAPCPIREVRKSKAINRYSLDLSQGAFRPGFRGDSS